jgi:hypothetical protein
MITDMNSNIFSRAKKLTLFIILIIIVSPLIVNSASSLQLTNTSEYAHYVHTYMNAPQGNYTYVEKPIFPVLISNSQIPIGGNWTIITPLQAEHNYHIYCYGAWINTSSQAKTDYDFYVYNPQGILVSSHTESAGFPPHLGTTTDDPFFAPTQSGNYSFVIENNPIDSQGAQQATFMIIENLKTDQWYTSYLEGRHDSNSSLCSTWAYEFVTNTSKVALYAQVPTTLDVYEARLYLMNNAQSSNLNSCPLPLEAGLYGNLSGSVGGYNFESTGYRGVAYASCEYMGQQMFLNYTSSYVGLKLYQLVLIGEQGSGNIELMLKTNFENGTLTPVSAPTRVHPEAPTRIAFSSSNNNTLNNAQLSYTVDNWTSVNTLDMQISNQTCNATIPGQIPGSIVLYRITASDILKNDFKTAGNYTVKEQAALNITTIENIVTLGKNITINGVITPKLNQSIVKVEFLSGNETQTLNSVVSSNGSFVTSFKPALSGSWSVIASSPETQTTYQSYSQQLQITVIEPPFYIKYSLFIILGLVGAMAAGGVVYYLKFRGR